MATETTLSNYEAQIIKLQETINIMARQIAELSQQANGRCQQASTSTSGTPAGSPSGTPACSYRDALRGLPTGGEEDIGRKPQSTPTADAQHTPKRLQTRTPSRLQTPTPAAYRTPNTLLTSPNGHAQAVTHSPLDNTTRVSPLPQPPHPLTKHGKEITRTSTSRHYLATKKGNNQRQPSGTRRQEAHNLNDWLLARARTAKRGEQKIDTQGNALPLKNSFGVLKLEEFAPVYFLVGDSNIKYQNNEFKQRQSNRKVLCRPGATVQSLTNQVKKLNTKREDVIMVHVGRENLCTQKPGQLFRSEALLDRYRKLMKTMKSKADNGIITGILPMMADCDTIYSRIKYINSAVKNIAHQEGLHYVDTEDVFKGRPELFQRNGRLLNARGITHFGTLLSTEVEQLTSGTPGQGSDRAQGTSDRAQGTSDRAQGTSDRAQGTSGTPGAQGKSRIPGPSSETPGPSSGTPGPSSGTPGPSIGTQGPKKDGLQETSGTPGPGNDSIQETSGTT